MLSRSRRIAFLLVTAVAVVASSAGCDKKKAKSAADEDNSKAFAELGKNDKEDTSAKPPASDGPEKAKGPVFPAPFTAEQIRDATKNGRTYRYKIEMPNKPTKEYVI